MNIVNSEFIDKLQISQDAQDVLRGLFTQINITDNVSHIRDFRSLDLNKSCSDNKLSPMAIFLSVNELLEEGLLEIDTDCLPGDWIVNILIDNLLSRAKDDIQNHIKQMGDLYNVISVAYQESLNNTQ
ncbi:hypothetical protein [Dyadobacter sp. CY312]|uniref:hypothetical protein n=1 Tax=Dyadobacter sp. CY312 TaxID=2907303 RepID=UPI001F1AED10|nr:hypothetical protein [Dyadobacter sp. CY312]MCE7039287.1 hypothetical protein [Dyadobacter sp. CY312]